MIQLSLKHEVWQLASPFRISRATKSQADVIVVEISDGKNRGWGECVPYAHYGETIGGVISTIQSGWARIKDKSKALDELPIVFSPGAARNAVECALLHFEARRNCCRVYELLRLNPPKAVVTAYTIGLDTVENMRRKAQQNRHRPVLKVKLDRDNVVGKISAIRDVAPTSRLIVDANEAWDAHILEAALPALISADVALIEQPLPANQDADLSNFSCPISIAADESCHQSRDIPNLVNRYQSINIKLDKAGGLRESLSLAKSAKEHDLNIMVGCMISTSLSMAPALLIAGIADFVDLDGPMLLETDREHGLKYIHSVITPPTPELWG